VSAVSSQHSLVGFPLVIDFLCVQQRVAVKSSAVNNAIEDASMMRALALHLQISKGKYHNSDTYWANLAFVTLLPIDRLTGHKIISHKSDSSRSLDRQPTA
jgi:hypothetical protein